MLRTNKHPLLPSIPTFNRASDQFPAVFSMESLFATDLQGVWLDISRLTTLYQDTAGTIPVTVPGDPVGLVRDLSGRGNHASHATALSKPRLGRHPSSGLRNQANGAQAVNTAAWGSGVVSNGVTYTKVGTGTENGVPYVDIHFTGTSTAGQHAVGWSQSNSKILMTSGSAVASMTARVIAGTPPNGSISGDAGNGLKFQIFERDASNATLTTTPSNGIVESVDTAVVLSKTVVTAGTANLTAFIVLEGGPTEVIDVTYRIKGLQFEVGSTPTALQYNLSQYDITEAGYVDVWYLLFDGIDDYLATPVINWGTDEVTVVAAIDAPQTSAQSIIVTGGGNLSTVGFAMVKLSDNRLRWRSSGSAVASTNSTLVTGARQIVSGRGKISTDTNSMRINGVLHAQSAADQGGGIFADYVVGIGGLQPFIGRIYGILAINRLLADAELARAERYMANLCGVTIP